MSGGHISRDPRTLNLNSEEAGSGDLVVYWMQASQRILHNHALDAAIHKANALKLPLVVFFGIKEDYPEANERHFMFMLQGLSEVREKLEVKKVQMVVRRVEPVLGAIELSKEAAYLFCDRGYLRHQVEWRKRLAEEVQCPLVQVETDLIIPAETLAEKEMYSAATLRPRINRLLDDFMIAPEEPDVKLSSLDLSFDSMETDDVGNVIKGLDLDRSVKFIDWIGGGTSGALSTFKNFIENKLARYHIDRNDPGGDIQSGMSPYLHFGQISPLTLALIISEMGGPGSEAYLEELVVRRELAFNFVHYNGQYDSIDCLPGWAAETLCLHEGDSRDYIYNREELERADTHDPFWNAAQKEMRLTGKMHNYMRMYWGKKLLEWMGEPAEAFKTALYLNNKYSLDGRDPNSYAGVAWCFGKHDRPWTERPIFGKVRYMNDRGLLRKFNMDRYIERVSSMEERDVPLSYH
ncbi:MAG: deoxyribodipyrimidine photo-lyase [Thermoplasmatota archaeon]